jgi:hypothetical protein
MITYHRQDPWAAEDDAESVRIHEAQQRAIADGLVGVYRDQGSIHRGALCLSYKGVVERHTDPALDGLGSGDPAVEALAEAFRAKVDAPGGGMWR